MAVALIISFLTILGLIFPGYYPMHDDLQVMRIFQLEKCFADGQIPCRWVSDMAFGYGQALFNFYSATPYYLGVLIRIILPISILDTVKLLFAVSLIAGAVGMYLLSKEFFGRWGGVLSSALYAFAPYKAVNVYVRGALAESFSLAILPFLWLFIHKSIKTPTLKNVSFLSIAIALLLANHNISTFIFFGFTLAWVLFLLLNNLKIKSILAVLSGSILGFSLAGFFIIPVIFETKLIKSEIFTTDYSYFAGHFVTLKQLFISRFWGYGGSIFGEEDGMSFQVGWPHWWVAILVGLASFFSLLKKRNSQSLLALTILSLSSFALFLTHNRSTFIWNLFPFISFVQFPWRFLGICVFLISFAAGSVKKVFIPIVLLLTISLNIGYFKPETIYNWMTDDLKLSGDDFAVQQKSAPLDYMPKTVKSPPTDIAPDKPVLVKGNADLPNLTKTSKTFFFDANVFEHSVVDVPIIYFPDWEVYLLEGQGNLIDVAPSDNEGVIRIELPEGKHMVYGRLVDTPARTIGNLLTVIAFFVLMAMGVAVARNSKFK